MAQVHDITRIIARHQPKLAALAGHAWDNPGLRWEQDTAVAAQIKLAEAEGFTVTRDLAGIPTAFAAEAGTGGPVFAVLGEYDALADLSHAAGGSRTATCAG